MDTAQAPPSAVAETVADQSTLLAINDATTNFTISYNREVFRVHKSKLTENSTYFEHCLRFAYGKERQEYEINLDAEDPQLVEAMLEFMYQGDYELPLDPIDEKTFAEAVERQQQTELSDEPKSTKITEEILTHGKSPYGRESRVRIINWTEDSHCVLRKYNLSVCRHGFICTKPVCVYKDLENKVSPSHMTVHASIYSLADYFGVDGLKHLALTKFKAAIHIYWHAADFAEAIREVYTSTPESDTGLRDIVLNVLVDFPLAWKRPSIKALMEEFGALKLAVLKKRHDMQCRQDDGGLVYGW